MEIYDLVVPQMQRALRNLHKWLERASQHEKGEALLQSRLASDQFPLVKQAQSACDNAKMMSGRLAGKEWPAHPDTETTFAQLFERIASVQSYLETLTRQDFAGAEARKIKMPWFKPEHHLTAADYIVQHAMPNFYFHLVHAYAILRHEGVQLGKADYIGGLTFQTS
jgi:hypothetical protein